MFSFSLSLSLFVCVVLFGEKGCLLIFGSVKQLGIFFKAETQHKSDLQDTINSNKFRLWLKKVEAWKTDIL